MVESEWAGEYTHIVVCSCSFVPSCSIIMYIEIFKIIDVRLDFVTFCLLPFSDFDNNKTYGMCDVHVHCTLCSTYSLNYPNPTPINYTA